MTPREQMVRTRILAWLREHRLQDCSSDRIMIEGLYRRDGDELIMRQLLGDVGQGVDPYTGMHKAPSMRLPESSVALLRELEQLVFECMGRAFEVHIVTKGD